MATVKQMKIDGGGLSFKLLLKTMWYSKWRLQRQATWLFISALHLLALLSNLYNGGYKRVN